MIQSCIYYIKIVRVGIHRERRKAKTKKRIFILRKQDENSKEKQTKEQKHNVPSMSQWIRKGNPHENQTLARPKYNNNDKSNELRRTEYMVLSTDAARSLRLAQDFGNDDSGRQLALEEHVDRHEAEETKINSKNVNRVVLR